MRQSDEAGYVAFVRAHSAVLFHDAYRMTGDYQGAEDLLHKALVRVYQRWPRVGGAEGALGYAREVMARESPLLLLDGPLPAQHVAHGVTPPEVNAALVRSRARASRRRRLLAVAATVIAATGMAVLARGDSSAPTPSQPIEVVPSRWIADLATGAPPRTAYWHAGVLHLGDVEIETSFRVSEIEVAGDTVLVGGGAEEGEITTWALVRGDRFEAVPVERGLYPRLSADGDIAYWTTRPSRNTTRFTAWDTRTNTELASRDLSGVDEGLRRLFLIGVGRDGIAYWVDQTNASVDEIVTGAPTPVTRWDIRAGTVEPTEILYDPSDFAELPTVLDEVSSSREDALVSPDGNREVFMRRVSGDSPPDCCTKQLRVRPVESDEPGEVSTLQLPRGVPHVPLLAPASDRGAWAVWWETDKTVLLDAVIQNHSYLVRCPASGGPCERVFDLGHNESPLNLYVAEWEKDWIFARFPRTE